MGVIKSGRERLWLHKFRKEDIFIHEEKITEKVVRISNLSPGVLLLNNEKKKIKNEKK